MADRAAVDLGGVRREHGYHRLAVKHVVDETADTRSFVLDVPDHLQSLFHYRAGQFCTFRVRFGDDEVLRSYSMSSAPETDGDLTVTVKRVPGGLVSNWFHDEVHEGDVLEATRPAGVFCTGAGAGVDARPVLAFAGGSGVTPVVSIAKSVLAGTGRPVKLLYANRDAASVIFEHLLDELEAGHPGRLAVRHHLDDDGGFLDPSAVTTFVGGDLDAEFFICGPTPFMDLVERTLLDLGVDREHIAIERFVNDGQPLPTDPPVADDASDPGDAPTEVTIILKGKRHEIAYQPGDTLLDTARRGGLRAPFSCEAGNCATCMALLLDGTATMRANNALTPDEVEEGWILTCQSLPHGPKVTVEYESL